MVVSEGRVFRPLSVAGEPLAIMFRRGSCPINDAARLVLADPEYAERKQHEGHAAHLYFDRMIEWRAALIFPDGQCWNVLVLVREDAAPQHFAL